MTEIVSYRGGIVGETPAGDDADPITTEVIRRALFSGAEQMKIALCRTAFSPVIYEMVDFCCVLYDRDVRLLAQAEAMPSWLGTMSFCIESTVAAVGGADCLEDGDILFTTYGYDTGSHPQDAAVVMPAFADGELVGYAATKAHHMDIGAKAPYCSDTTDNFQEGVIFPGVKLYRAGVRQEDLYRTLVANSRMPVALAGDLDAQVVAATTGVRALNRLIDRYGMDRFFASVEHMLEHGEAVVRAYLSQIPDGRYEAHGVMDNNGVTDELIRFTLNVEVRGSDIVVDFTNAPPEQPGPVNCPVPNTVSIARYTLMCLAGAQELANEGHFRPIEVRTRPGTMFHPLPPAPIFLYNWPGRQACDAVLHALAEAMPGAVPAGSGADVCAFIWWGENADGSMWASATDHFVGHGATRTSDGGAPLIVIANSGITNTPVEVWESRHPFLIEEFSLAQDSGGAGRTRGGPGMDIRYRILGESFATVIVERTKTPPWGLFGGGEGRPNRWLIEHPDGTVEDGPGKVTGLRLPAGSVVVMQSGGGGGYGPPSERPADDVLRDVREGYVSLPQAVQDYPHAFATGPED